MPQKSKVGAEEKVRVVEAYLTGEIGYTAGYRSAGIGETTFRRWISRYGTEGASGLLPHERNRKYTKETKTAAVSDYLSGRGSKQDICNKYSVRHTRQLREWIVWYNDHKDFKEANSGGAIYMVKGRKSTMEERIEIVSYCIANNKDYSKTIEQYGVSYQQIYGWVRKYESGGVDGLSDRRGKSKDEASMNETDRLRAQLKLKEAENLRLQMENDLLKKLEALERGWHAD